MVNNSNLVNLVSHWGSQKPNSMAYTFLREGQKSNLTLTYGQLERQAKAIAAYLQSQFSPGTTALLIYPPGLEFCSAFFGCLCAEVIAIPVPSPEIFGRSRIISRIDEIAKNARPSLILTTAKIKLRLEKLNSQITNFPNTEIVTDNINEDWSNKWIKPNINGETIAYLQYTSGSTANPKGVTISYDNLISNLVYRQEILDYQSDSIIANWTPHFHDYGLVAGLISALYVGCSCYIMSPLAFMKRPISWLETISHYKATHSLSPNFGYDYCIKHTTEEERQGLDLSSWQVAEVGAEPIRPETLKCFTEIFKPYGFDISVFSPGYGLAECVLTFTGISKNKTLEFCTVEKEALAYNRIIPVSQKTQNTSDSITLTCSGYPVRETKIAIVNPKTLKKCVSNEVGEIWGSSRSVSQGYWNRSAENKDTFQAHLPEFRDRSFLRTGDLGFIKNGQLFITGRLKDLIIIRGENYYPQDIELTLEKSHPQLRSNCSAAFSIDYDRMEQLVVIGEVNTPSKNNINSNEIFTAIRNAIIKNHGLSINAIALLKPGSIPKTSSGKIKRHACRSNFISKTLDSITIWNLEGV